MLRSRRRSLDVDDQLTAAAAVADTVVGWLNDCGAQMVAGYSATDGELSPQACLAAVRDSGATTVYPRIADDRMTFHVVSSEADLVEGDWGLLEPRVGAIAVPPTEIDVVLTPLVGFDARCGRLGRGKAYYDRAFAFLLDADRPRRPVLVGLAHGCQEVEVLPLAAHDVRLDAVVTPAELFGTLPAGH